MNKNISNNISLFGVIEWIINQDGTIEKFNSNIVIGEVRGLKYRYFISEGWIGLRTDDCPVGKIREYTTCDNFINGVKKYEKIR